MIPLAITGIRFYQRLLSPALHRLLAGSGWGCRFFPTCSAYLASALRQYGLAVGFVLFLKRISRCHPGSPGGYDPVP